MTKKDNKTKYPYENGIQYTKEHFNSFEKDSRVPEAVKEEKDVSCMQILLVNSTI